MEEYIDMWSEDGKPTGKSCTKDLAHLNGYFHPTIHLWLYSADGKILMQQRGATKETFPSLWDVSVAGHVSAGETIEVAVLREAKEEVGLMLSTKDIVLKDIRKNINMHPNGIKDCEFQHVFLSELKTPIEDLIIQEEEVDAIRLFSFEELKESIHTPETATYKIVPADYSYYLYIIEEVKKLI